VKIPDKYQGIFKRALKKGAKKDAIKAKCLDCCCFQKAVIADCTTRNCPLWVHRPYQVKGNNNDKN
jgi:hypothetical protein